MHIMLTNDDGVHALGIRTLARVLSEAGHRVSVCAPDRERSAASHSITLRRALNVEKVEFPGAEIAYAADGTPADCARLGLYLIPDVDLVISGINNGSNLGGACVYSGTVGAAMEASMSGVPALASSIGAFDHSDYVPAARITLKVAEWMMEHPLARGEFYNLNMRRFAALLPRRSRPIIWTPPPISRPRTANTCIPTALTCRLTIRNATCCA